MKALFQGLFTFLLFILLSDVVFAQEKTQSYYNTHETEILPDAKAAFEQGKYERAEELCRWHYIIVGDHAADPLRDLAKRCVQLSTDLTELKTAGMTKEAKEVANTLLSINPYDPTALKMLEEKEEPELPLPVDTLAVEVPVIADTVVTETTIREEAPIEEPNREPVQIVDVNPNTDSAQGVLDESKKPDEPVPYRTKFVLKAGASVLDLKQIAKSVAPGGSLGLYDLGGSRIGLEAGGYYCADFNSTVSLLGIDASLVFRVAKGVYPKFGVGYFSYNAVSAVGSATHGLCGGAGLTFLVGGHLCLDVGLKYYPAFSILNSEQAITSGISYQFPVVKQFYSGGIAPMVSLGWAF